MQIPSNGRETERASVVESEGYPSPGYAWYVVAVLTLAYVFSFIDRQILNLLVGPIQRDLEIGEKQMSLLMGASFAVFYTLFGIPLGRLADTWTRSWRWWIVLTTKCNSRRRNARRAERFGVTASHLLRQSQEPEHRDHEPGIVHRAP